MKEGGIYLDKLDQRIGGKLKVYRETKGFSMRDVAKMIDIDQSYISKIEKGTIPSLQKLKQLSDLYGVQLASLFLEEPEIPSEVKIPNTNWIRFIERMEERHITPEEIEHFLDAFKILNKL